MLAICKGFQGNKFKLHPIHLSNIIIIILINNGIIIYHKIILLLYYFHKKFKNRIFVPCKLFYPGLMFLGKIDAYLSEALFRYSTLKQAPGLTHKYKTWLEKLASVNHSSLLKNCTKLDRLLEQTGKACQGQTLELIAHFQKTVFYFKIFFTISLCNYALT